MQSTKKLIIATAIFSIYASVANAHLLAFHKLTPAHQPAKVITSFQLTEKEIIEEFHYRAKFFQVEPWLLSQNIQLGTNYHYAQHYQEIESKRALVSSQAAGTGSVLKMHDLFDPLRKSYALSTINKINISGIVAISICNAYKSINIKNNTPNLVPKFKAPLSFIQGIDPRNSNTSEYKLSEGISFDCVEYRNKLKPISREDIKTKKAQRSVSKIKQRTNSKHEKHQH